MENIRTIVIDDSLIYRRLIADAINRSGMATVEAVASDGIEGLVLVDKYKPSVVFCDMFMPGLNGVQVLERIKQRHNLVNVVMISSVNQRYADMTIEALEKGAVDFIRKPDSIDADKNAEQLAFDIQKVLNAVKLRLLVPGVSFESAKAPASMLHSYRGAFSVVVIGVSTGGPDALGRILSRMPADFTLPVVVVQHIPAGFTESLVKSLNSKSPLKVFEALEGQDLNPGCVYISSGGRHLTVKRQFEKVLLSYNDDPPENSCRPSVDVLFRSAAQVYGNKGVLAVIMTGMGEDGLAGVRELKKGSVYCITQSKETCVVYGMPKAIDDHGLSDERLELDQIADRISILSRR